MGIFTSRWERAHRSLNGLSAAQKLAAGALLCGIVAAGYWMTKQAGRGAMEPVLDQPFATADVIQIAEHLTERKVPHEVRDGKVYVPAERKLEVLSDLIYSDTLIGNTESGFDALVKQASVFDTPSKTDKMFNHARQKMLQVVIARFRGVRKATVLIDPTNERRIGGQSVTPSALVDIQTRSGEGNPRQLATAAINAVTGAVSSMNRERVKVTIDGASYNLGMDDFGGDLLEQRQRCEQAYVTKVRGILSFIPDVLVSVSVDLNVQSVEEETRTKDFLDEPHAQAPTTQDAISEMASAVLANAVPGGVDEAMKTTKAPLPPPVLSSETVQKFRTPAGKETVLSASVVVPRSYFVQIYRRGVSKAEQPSDALLQPVVDAQLGRIRQLVRTSLGLKNDADVTVDLYEDAGANVVAGQVPPQQVVAANPQQAGAAASLTRLWNGSRQWGVWIIGGMTLLIASMIFRRGSAAMAMPQPVAHPTPRPVRVNASYIDLDEQDEDDDDDDEVDAALMRQVRDLAAAHPQDTARVLRDWIYQG